MFSVGEECRDEIACVFIGFYCAHSDSVNGIGEVAPHSGPLVLYCCVRRDVCSFIAYDANVALDFVEFNGLVGFGRFFS